MYFLKHLYILNKLLSNKFMKNTVEPFFILVRMNILIFLFLI